MGNSRFQIISIVVLILVLVTVGLAQTRAGKLGVGVAGIGYYFVDEFWSFTLGAEGVGTFTSRLDGVKGSSDDMYGRVSLGLRYHFFDQDFVKRMIDAFEKRGK